MRILVVDDEFVSREKLTAILSAHGNCDAAPDGRTALEMVEKAYRDGNPYELVTMDLNMPDMSGHVVVQEMRHWEQGNPQIANGYAASVLIITATKEIRDVMESFDEGAEAYIVKPVTPENVAEAIGKINLPGPYTPPATDAPPPPAAPSGIGSDIQPPSPSGLRPDEMASDYMGEYLDSTRDKLGELEAAALELETADDVLALTNGIMRTLHSLKGEAGMVGLGGVSDVLHRTETAVKTHEDDPACADFILRIADWMNLVVAYLEDPTEGERLEAEQAALRTTDVTTSPTESPSEIGGDISFTHASKLEYARVVAEFVNDYIEASTKRTALLCETIEQIQASETGTDFNTSVIGILNALKGEAAMIGLGQVSKGINDAENVFKDHLDSPKDCCGLLRRCVQWISDVSDHLRSMHSMPSA
jgi:two-component system chemotaxis response regulator CheY